MAMFVFRRFNVISKPLVMRVHRMPIAFICEANLGNPGLTRIFHTPNESSALCVARAALEAAGTAEICAILRHLRFNLTQSNADGLVLTRNAQRSMGPQPNADGPEIDITKRMKAPHEAFRGDLRPAPLTGFMRLMA